MPEPTSSAALTLATQALAVPVVTIWGVRLGVRPDVLLAGWCGAVAAMALLNTVPGSGDTWPELMRTSLRRIAVSVGSAMTAAYTAPLWTLIGGFPDALLLSVSFVTGAGAMQLLPRIIDRFGRGDGAGEEAAAPARGGEQ